MLGRALRGLLRLATGGAVLPAIAASAAVARLRPRRARPRLFWGVAPIINIKYQSEALRRQGYESETVVHTVYAAINRRSDFDVAAQDLAQGPLARLRPLVGAVTRRLGLNLGSYLLFARALHRYDVFNYYFGETILTPTPLRRFELQLLRLAGKRSVFMPYGGDVQVAHRVRGLLYKHAMNVDYPRLARREDEILRNVDYAVRNADFVISGCDWVDYMPWWDLLLPGHFCVDVAQWTPPAPRPKPPGAPVVVLHAPNHRTIKGTSLLERAVAELRAEGLPVELRVVEKVQNTKIRELMAECDIVADQFIIGWYAMFAIEGMAMGKPVMTYLRPDLLQLYTVYSYGGECPLVSAPPEDIKTHLRRLVLDPALRADLGRRGRQYVERWHSLEYVGGVFDGIYKKLWGHA